MTQYENAMIKGTGDFIKRIMDGEVFFLMEDSSHMIDRNKRIGKIFYNSLYDFPFRISYDDNFSTFDFVEWGNLQHMMISYKWEDHIGDGVFCHVWHRGCRKEDGIISVVDGYNSIRNMYSTILGDFWDNAEPVTPEEAEKYIFRK